MTNKTITWLLAILILAMPIAIAENETATADIAKTTAKEYGWGEQFMDRVRLWFAWKDEQKLTVMNKIQERRESHYQFLVGNGKSDQAEQFRQRTQEMTQTFEQQRTRIQEKLGKVEGKVQERVQARNESAGSGSTIQERDQIRDPTTHADNQTSAGKQGANA